MIGLSGVRARYRNLAEPLRSERRLELAVLIVVLVILLQLVWLAFREFSGVAVAVVAPAPDSLRVAEAARHGSIDMQQSLQLQSRPLFWASRRPLDEVRVERVAETSSGTPAKRLQDFQLTGVIGAGEQGLAIVTYKKELLRMSVGDELDGWTLRTVDPQEAVFVSAGTRDVRRLVPVPVEAPPPVQASGGSQGAAVSSAAATASAGNGDDAAAGEKAPQQKPPRSKKSLSLGSD